MFTLIMEEYLLPPPIYPSYPHIQPPRCGDKIYMRLHALPAAASAKKPAAVPWPAYEAEQRRWVWGTTHLFSIRTTPKSGLT